MPQKIKSKLKPLFSLLGILVVFLGFSISTYASYGLTYVQESANNKFGLRLPVITGFQGQDIYVNSTLNGIHYEIDYDINGWLNTASKYYLYGYENVDIYLYFDLGSNLNFADLKNFTYAIDDLSPQFVAATVDRPSIIQLSDGFAFHFTLLVLFDNFLQNTNVPYNLVNLHFSFDLASTVSRTLEVRPYDDNGVSGITFNSNSASRLGKSTTPYNAGLYSTIASAINSSSDIDSIISLLTALSGYSSDAFDELTYIYSTNQNIYTRLGLILEWLEAWSEQEDISLIEVLAELQGVISANNDIISELPSFSWEDYGNNISDLYYAWQNAIRPAAPSGRDNTLLWQWLGGRWVLYILGLVFILGTISFILYGKK